MKSLITLYGEPKSTQHIYRFTCRGSFGVMYMTNEGKILKLDYQLQAKKQWKKKPLTSPLSLEINIYFGTKRKSDWDNFHKLTMDALSGIVWVDDSQIMEAKVSKKYDKMRPRVAVVVSDYDN